MGWRMSRLFRQTRFRLRKALVLAYFRFKGPPRVLKYGPRINRAILAHFGAKIGGENVRIYSPVILHRAEQGYSNLEMGNGCILGGNNFLDLSDKITLGEGVGLAPGALIITHNRFNYNLFLEEKLATACGTAPVRVGDGASIKAHAVITMGVEIGSEAIIAAGAVVLDDLPNRTFAAGVPARVVRGLHAIGDKESNVLT